MRANRKPLQLSQQKKCSKKPRGGVSSCSVPVPKRAKTLVESEEENKALKEQVAKQAELITKLSQAVGQFKADVARIRSSRTEPDFKAWFYLSQSHIIRRHNRAWNLAGRPVPDTRYKCFDKDGEFQSDDNSGTESDSVPDTGL